MEGLFAASVESPGHRGNASVVSEWMSHSIIIILQIYYKYLSGGLVGHVFQLTKNV